MVLSDKHKYVFIELPFTASTAISRELRECYDGRKILVKHANYTQFLMGANQEQKQYFSFSGVRNPLDEAVSRFLKLKSNPQTVYEEPWVTPQIRRRYKWVSENDRSFSDYFFRYFRFPFENWASLDHKRMDYVYRLENVVDEFDTILRRIGIEPLRSLPVRHKTAGKAPWKEYYPPHTRSRAAFVFGPFMNRWGYSFPEEWGIQGVPQNAEIIYRGKVVTKNAARRLLAMRRSRRRMNSAGSVQR